MSESNSRILVSAASKHGSTAEIAAKIAEIVGDRGFDVTVAEPQEAPDPSQFRAVVLGSGVYAGHWLGEAKELAERIGSAQTKPGVWLFSSGPIGDPPKPDEDPIDVEPISEATAARGHRLFAGKLDRDELSFGEKAIVVALRAPEGDFRDWAAIEAWANEIADSLQSSEVSS